MTFKQLEKIREALSELEILKKTPDARKIYHLDENLSYFLGKDYPSPSLLIGVDIMYDNASKKEDMLSDIDRIKSVLEGMIAQSSNYSLANEIIDVINEGKGVGKDYSSRQQFISKVYFSYGDYIKLDPLLISVAKDSIVRKSALDIDFGDTETTVDDVVIQSVIAKLEQYAESLLQKKEAVPSTKKSNPTVVVNNIATATANVNIDISIEIEKAIKQVEDACLPDEQEKEVLAKIQKLKELNEVLSILFIHSYLNFNFVSYVTYIEMFSNIEVGQKPVIISKSKFKPILKALNAVKNVPQSIKSKFPDLNKIGIGKKVQRLLKKYKIDYDRYKDVFTIRGKVVHGALVDIEEMHTASEQAKELLTILTLKKLNYVGYIRNFTNNNELILVKDMSKKLL